MPKHKENGLLENEKPSGKQLKKARKELGLSQEKVAVRAKVSQASVSQYERGKRRRNRAAFDVDVIENLRKYYCEQWNIIFLNNDKISILESKII